MQLSGFPRRSMAAELSRQQLRRSKVGTELARSRRRWCGGPPRLRVVGVRLASVDEYFSPPGVSPSLQASHVIFGWSGRRCLVLALFVGRSRP